MQIESASTISDIERATPYQSQKNASMQGIWQPQPLTPQHVSSDKALFLSPHSQRLQLLADRAGFDFDLRTPAKQYNRTFSWQKNIAAWRDAVLTSHDAYVHTTPDEGVEKRVAFAVPGVQKEESPDSFVAKIKTRRPARAATPPGICK